MSSEVISINLSLQVMLRTYALSPEVLRRILRRTFWRFQLITTLSFLLFGVYLASFNRPVTWALAGPIILIIALAYFLIIFFNYRQQMRLLYSVRVELDNSSLTYRQLGEDPVRVMRADVIGARSRKDGLLVETVDPRVALLVPYGLANDGDQDVRSTLAAWVGVDEDDLDHPGQRANRGLVMVGLFGSLFILLFANTLWIILPLGAALVAYGMYTERRLARLHDSSPGQARSYNMAFSFLLFVILMKSCLLGMLAMLAR